jgi:hypothetical protein
MCTACSRGPDYHATRDTELSLVKTNTMQSISRRLHVRHVSIALLSSLAIRNGPPGTGCFALAECCALSARCFHAAGCSTLSRLVGSFMLNRRVIQRLPFVNTSRPRSQPAAAHIWAESSASELHLSTPRHAAKSCTTHRPTSPLIPTHTCARPFPPTSTLVRIESCQSVCRDGIGGNF